MRGSLLALVVAACAGVGCSSESSGVPPEGPEGVAPQSTAAPAVTANTPVIAAQSLGVVDATVPVSVAPTEPTPTITVSPAIGATPAMAILDVSLYEG